MPFSLITNSKDETILLGEKIGKLLKAHDVILLTGDLGAGKTTLVSGLAKSLNVKDEILSPTFNILKCYFNAPIPLYHIDAYRLENNNSDIGLEEYIEGDGVAVIEWPNFIAHLLNIPHLEIEIKNLGNNKRELTFFSKDKRYIDLIKEVKK